MCFKEGVCGEEHLQTETGKVSARPKRESSEQQWEGGTHWLKGIPIHSCDRESFIFHAGTKSTDARLQTRCISVVSQRGGPRPLLSSQNRTRGPRGGRASPWRLSALVM